MDSNSGTGLKDGLLIHISDNADVAEDHRSGKIVEFPDIPAAIRWLVDHLAAAPTRPLRHALALVSKNAHGSELILDQRGRRAVLAGTDINLSPQEFDLLTALTSRPGHAWTYEHLFHHVWDQTYLGDPDPIHSAVGRLRAKLRHADSITITTLRGVGYRLDFAA